ncbi:GntR family transcriptional regulator [Mesorhizobium sp. M1B.F.Ca.ET.045.04.1.1]|uniref:GntR family transcriptional regulator n=1 Tax=Mesorhizobium sp. M1B.F.Ca.ET.045.04.1.1 TaxID=2493673 RepID=UPI001FDEBF49|nr:GntR family transcriptional regulator [Mesorhizobium sp. M1B.F.Ca.ET.045.04.1.1]
MQLTRAEPGHRSSQMRGPLPVHLQISEMLIREIAAGRLADGARLPSEREMAASLGIAVGTLRRALADLTEKGLLDRVQGSGNYVRARGDLLGVYAFFRLERVDGGGLPTAEVLSVDRLPKPSDLPQFGSAHDAHRIRRLRRLDGQAAAAEEIWLDASRADRLAREDLSESLYLHYRLALGFSIVRAEDRVGVAPAPDWAPADFRLPPGQIVGFVERIAWAGDGDSVEYSRSWFDPEAARYVARFK